MAGAAAGSAAPPRANSVVRTRGHRAERRDKARAKGAARRKRQREDAALGDAAPPRKVPRTIEDVREYDDETGRPVGVERALGVDDEFAGVLAGERRPSVMITTGARAGVTSFGFVREVLPVFPGSTYYERRGTTVEGLLRHAVDGGFTDVLVVKEDKKRVSTLMHAHLPDGPTAVYKVSSYAASKEIRGHGRATGHEPEVLLNNFTTALGVRVGRMLGSLFPHTPNFVGRQAATFHCQRDFIFFRFHRYVFAAGRDKARLQELGPRFTLKLQGLQRGLFVDPQTADHEWKNSTKKDVARRRFFL
jgi:ribosome production factor 1